MKKSHLQNLADSIRDLTDESEQLEKDQKKLLDKIASIQTKINVLENDKRNTHDEFLRVNAQQTAVKWQLEIDKDRIRDIIGNTFDRETK